MTYYLFDGFIVSRAVAVTLRRLGLGPRLKKVEVPALLVKDLDAVLAKIREAQ